MSPFSAREGALEVVTMADIETLARRLGAFGLAVGLTAAAFGAAPPAPWVTGEILVRPGPGIDAGTLDSDRAGLEARLGRRLLDGEVELWLVTPGLEADIAQLAAQLPSISWAEPNYTAEAFDTVPNDSGFGAQWGHVRIGSAAAWDVATGDAAITIAVIDTGVDTGHPDLAAKIVAGHDFVDDDADPHDLNGHGTHVAGVAAAVTDNGVGIAGTSWGARIMPIRVLDADGWGSTADITDGITWARQHGASVLNLSLGGSEYSHAMEDAVAAAHAAGCLVVAAMGNYRTAGNPTNYPAAYDHVLAVAATATDDTYAYYSQYGPHCDLAAPGGEMSYYHDPDGVYSTTPTYACTLSGLGYSLNYDRLQGTSQAAPFVAGVAAILRGMLPFASPDAIEGVLERTATDRGPVGWDPDYGWGLLRADVAVGSVLFGDGFESGTTAAWSGTS